MNHSGSVFGRDLTAAGFHKALVLLCLLGLIVRIGFFVEHAQTPSFGVPTLDQKYYDMVARMLLEGEDLHTLRGFRPLLYPMFLAVCYKLGGAWGVDLALFAQHLLGIATGLIVALLGARLFGHRLSGVIAGALFLLAPVPLYFEGELLIEPTYTFLICLGLWLHLVAAGALGWRGVWLWALCGGLTVLTAQARANILVFLAIYPLFAAWRWLGWWRQRRAAGTPPAPAPAGGDACRYGVGAWATPLLGLAGALAMAVPWGFVNLKQSDHFHLLPNAGGVALYLGNKRTADGMVPQQERRIISGERYEDSIEVWAREEYEAAMRAQGRSPDPDPMAVSRYWTRRTFDEIQAAPAAWLKLMARKSWLAFWNAEVPNNKAFAFLQEEYAWLRLLPVRWVVLLMFVPAGLWLAGRWCNRDALVILFGYAALYTGANIVFFICDRYRYPVWPVAAVFAGGGLLAGIEAVRGKNARLAAGMLVSALLMAGLALPNWFGVKLPSYSRDYLFRSLAWYEKGRFAEALKDIDLGLELDPAEATALHHRGNVLFALQRFGDAAEAYRRTLEVSPGEPGVWNNLGAALQAQERRDEALSAFRRAIECRPPSKNAFLGITVIQIQTGQVDEAAKTLAQLEQLAPEPNAAALALRSVLARRRGETTQADALEQQARRLDAARAEWALQQAAGGRGNGVME